MDNVTKEIFEAYKILQEVKIRPPKPPKGKGGQNAQRAQRAQQLQQQISTIKRELNDVINNLSGLEMQQVVVKMKGIFDQIKRAAPHLQKEIDAIENNITSVAASLERVSNLPVGSQQFRDGLKGISNMLDGVETSARNLQYQGYQNQIADGIQALKVDIEELIKMPPMSPENTQKKIKIGGAVVTALVGTFKFIKHIILHIYVRVVLLWLVILWLGLRVSYWFIEQIVMDFVGFLMGLVYAADTKTGGKISQLYHAIISLAERRTENQDEIDRAKREGEERFRRGNANDVEQQGQRPVVLPPPISPGSQQTTPSRPQQSGGVGLRELD